MHRGKANGEVQLPQLLRAVQPDMKVVAILRDPVARMYSAFWYYGCLYNVYKDHGMTAKGFHKHAAPGTLLIFLQPHGTCCAQRPWGKLTLRLTSMSCMLLTQMGCVISQAARRTMWAA